MARFRPRPPLANSPTTSYHLIFNLPACVIVQARNTFLACYAPHQTRQLAQYITPP